MWICINKELVNTRYVTGVFIGEVSYQHDKKGFRVTLERAEGRENLVVEYKTEAPRNRLYANLVSVLSVLDVE